MIYFTTKLEGGFAFSKDFGSASLAESEKSLETIAGSKFLTTFVNESLWRVSRWRDNTNYKIANNSADIGVSIRSNCE